MNCLDGRRKKICFFIGNMSHSGGTERVLSTIANGLNERGYHVFIISLWGRGQSFFSLDERVKLYWLQERAHSHDVIKQLRCMSVILDREEPDFLVDVDIILCFYSVFFKKRKPGMYWISWEHFNYYYHFKKNNMIRFIARRIVCKFADWLIVLTDEDEGYYQENLKLRCGIRRIYNPLPYKASFSKRIEDPVIIAAGRLTRAKGYDMLIRSWKLLESKYPEWSVIIAGEGEERNRLEKETRRAGLTRLHFIGNVYPIEEYYEKAAFLVLSSREEGFGMVLIEAMHYSLPVVSYSCRSGPGEIVEDGKTGFLVETEDVMCFAKKMDLLMENAELRSRMGEAARESVRRFDREGILDQWEDSLEKVTNADI